MGIWIAFEAYFVCTLFMENQNMLKVFAAEQPQSLLRPAALATQAVGRLWKKLSKFSPFLIQSVKTNRHRTTIHQEYIVVTNEQ